MDIRGRFFSFRDQNLINSVGNELKNNIVETLVYLFKISVPDTNVNIYGEVKPNEGKNYYPGIPVYCFIERADLESEDEGFGVDRSQDLEFRFSEDDLKSVSFYPEMGDVISFNSRYYTVENVLNDKQLLGVQSNKNLSFIVKTHYTTLSSLNIISRQV